MDYQAINFSEKLAKFKGHWSPRIIAEMNDYQFKLVKIEGDFVWHDHPDTDETFIQPLKTWSSGPSLSRHSGVRDIRLCC